MSPQPDTVNSYLELELPAMNLVRSHWMLRLAARTTFALLILSVIALIFVPWQQSSRGYGRVVAFNPQEREQQVTSTAKGIIVNIRDDLREGSYVKQGELVMVLEPLAREAQQQLENQVKELKAKVSSSEAKMAFAQQAIDLQITAGEAIMNSVQEAVYAAEAKVEQAKEKVKGLDASVDRTKADFDRSMSLLEDGLTPQRIYLKDLEAYKKAVASFEEGESFVMEALKNLSSKKEEMIGKKGELDIKNRELRGKYQEAVSELATTKKELSETEQKLGEYGNRLEIRSPVDGYLHKLHALTGADVVKEGESLFTVVPDTEELAVELIIRGNDVSLLHLRDEVRLQFEGYPAIQFIGWPSVARGTFGGRIAAINPTDDGFGNFRILVIPDDSETALGGKDAWPNSQSLRQGILANGWVLLSRNDGRLSRVPLGFEIWRQLNGFPPVISSESPDKEKKSDKPSKIKLPKS